MNISDFYKNEYSSYALYDSFRSIACYIDGLKPSARKVIHTLKKKPNSSTKVSILAGTVAAEQQYIHGQQSLEGVIVGLAQDFCGSNNMNLLVPEGSFGNRNIPEAAASRYIFVSKSPILETLLKKDDEPLLSEQEFEGTIIEPKFFVPTLPLILINGSEGIGSGFAQKILPRNPTNIIKAIKQYFSKSKMDSSLFDVWYKDYDGEIKNVEAGKWEIRGKIDRLNSSMFNITEIPVGISLQQYIKVLDKLESDKVIKSYVDRSEDNRFLFEIRCEREFLKQDDETILETLKLIKRVTENYTCISENNSVREFKSVEELFVAYCDIRYEFYSKRRIYLLEKYKSELQIAENKFHFVMDVMNKKVTIFQKTKDEIYQQLERKFVKKDDSYEYLLSMRVDTFTTEKLESLQKDIDKIKQLLDDVINTGCKEMWLAELKTIKER